MSFILSLRHSSATACFITVSAVLVLAMPRPAFPSGQHLLTERYREHLLARIDPQLSELELLAKTLAAAGVPSEITIPSAEILLQARDTTTTETYTLPPSFPKVYLEYLSPVLVGGWPAGEPPDIALFGGGRIVLDGEKTIVALRNTLYRRQEMHRWTCEADVRTFAAKSLGPEGPLPLPPQYASRIHSIKQADFQSVLMSEDATRLLLLAMDYNATRNPEGITDGVLVRKLVNNSVPNVQLATWVVARLHARTADPFRNEIPEFALIPSQSSTEEMQEYLYSLLGESEGCDPRINASALFPYVRAENRRRLMRFWQNEHEKLMKAAEEAPDLLPSTLVMP